MSSSFWLYCSPTNFICPLKTTVDGISCLLRVLFESASLTRRREADESLVFDQQNDIRWLPLMKEETQGFEQALKHYFKKLYGVISSREDSSALRAIKTAS